ncbi:MAG: DUF480 domain-containing protein [Aquihabitans sp.]
MEPNLTPEACRVLGSLLEKELTVPTTYPLSLNAVVSACNQSSGRDPVLHLTDTDANEALDELRTLGLTRVLHPSHGARTPKHRQVADEALGLEPATRAVLTVLLLRGHQTPGELRSRTERLHQFPSVDEVIAALTELAGRDDPLVAELPRRPGRKEARWAHLLAGEPSEEPGSSPSPTADRPEPAASVPVPIPAEVAPLAALVGTWRGVGTGEYPTIETFRYTQEVEFRPVPGKAFLAYRSATRHRDDDRPLHAESGFLRLVGPGSVELLAAQASGIVEITEGLVDVEVGTTELLLTSTSIAGSSTAKPVTATERRYRVTGDDLVADMAMAAMGHPLTHHLHATLRRST